MLELRLEYIGNGQLRCRTRTDYELATTELEQGEHVLARLTRPRSVRQNAFFHVLVQAAHENQRAGPPLPTWQHLKHWLLIQAGHCDVRQFSTGSMSQEVAAALRQTFDTVDFTTDGRSIFMRTARSVSFRKCEADAMNEIVGKVVEIISREIVPGVNPEDLLREARTRAV